MNLISYIGAMLAAVGDKLLVKKVEKINRLYPPTSGLFFKRNLQ
ncbi:hypothetical protein [Actinobacillus pleuropneumoniae]|nr:hypothetical protein [Actinobacillus pleuropneumoniae]